MPVVHAPLLAIARESLENNIVDLPSGAGLTAGQGQFEALWTRDFCFAVPGLLHLGHQRVVRDHLVRLLSMRRRSDDLVPRLIDSVSPAWLRVLHFTVGKALRRRALRLPLRDPLKPEYVNEHAIPSIDSNLLVLRAAMLYLRHTGDIGFWRRHESDLIAVYGYYASRLKNGLVVQPPYADWQDSVRRTGRTLYTNMLYFLVSHGLVQHPEFEIRRRTVSELHHRIFRTFYDSEAKLLRSLAKGPHISLDGNLLALEGDFFDVPFGEQSVDGAAVYCALRAHPLWPAKPAVPGFATYPNYPDRWISLQVKLVGLRRYHDALYWSWLMVLCAKIAQKFGDQAEAQRLFDRLERMAERDRTVYEVYESNIPYAPWRSRFYMSESSFSWGAGMLIDALQSLPLRAEAKTPNPS